jgi:hypothetical protein
MIATLRWWKTLNHKIPQVCVQRERKRKIGTHLFFKKLISTHLFGQRFFFKTMKKMKKMPREEGTGMGCPVVLLGGFPCKGVMKD